MFSNTMFKACFRNDIKKIIPYIETSCFKREPKCPGWIYLIKEREFIKTNENIFKIGKTTSIKARMPAYPRDSRLYQCFYCPSNIHSVEKEFIRMFDEQFTKQENIGREYYSCKHENDILTYFNSLSARYIT